MAKVIAKDYDTVDSLIRKFNKKVERDGILKDMKKKEYYVPKSVRKKLKAEESRRAAEKARRKAEAARQAYENNNRW